MKLPYLRVANVLFNKLDLTDVQKIGVEEDSIKRRNSSFFQVSPTAAKKHIPFTEHFCKGVITTLIPLKKAAVAPFDGICSGDITVIEAKPNYLLPELLPFIIKPI